MTIEVVASTTGQRVGMGAHPYHISDHALIETERRNIPMDVLRRVLESPGQVIPAHSGRSAYQSMVEIEGKLYVVRAIEEDNDPLIVITVYRTGKIGKYWSNEP